MTDCPHGDAAHWLGDCGDWDAIRSDAWVRSPETPHDAIGAWRVDLCCSPAEVFFERDQEDCDDGGACC